MSSSSSSEPGDNLQSLVGNEHLSEDCVISSDSLDGLKDLKIKNLRNPFLGYLNINHVRNKIADLRCILKEIGSECISISETKLDSSFPDSQFKIDGYHFPPFRKDRNCHGGGLMVFVKSDIIVTRLTEYEPERIECICTKIIIAKKHWLIFSVYRPPQSGNIINFLTALHQTIDRASTKYRNIVIMGDMNINTLEHSPSLDKINELCDTLGLYNLMKVSTCEMKGSSTSIDLILTNCKHHCKHTHAFETGLSDFHNIVVTCFKNTYERLRPIYIQYRSSRKFDRNEFLSDLKNVSFEEALSSTNSEQAYEKFKELYSEVVDNHAPLKQRVIRGNQALFMSKDLSKQIMIQIAK